MAAGAAAGSLAREYEPAVIRSGASARVSRLDQWPPVRCPANSMRFAGRARRAGAALHGLFLSFRPAALSLKTREPVEVSLFD